MRILALGAGAVGGYFGGRLAQSGADVTFLVRPARAEKLRSRGLVIRSPKGDAELKVKVVTADEPIAPYDLVLLSCKAYDLESAVKAIKPAVGERTVILPVLNGMRHLDALDAAFGKERVLGGVAQIGATLGPEGEIRHLNPLETLRFGARAASQDDACARFEPIIKRAAFDGARSHEIMQEMWEKWVFLATLAGATCLFQGSVGEIMATSHGEELMRVLLDECAAVAAGAGFAARAEAREKALRTLTERGSKMTASMMRDFASGARIESDAIIGDMLNRAMGKGLPSVILKVVNTRLQVYEALK
jgi:2-dehydropantoate 2-reductase